MGQSEDKRRIGDDSVFGRFCVQTAPMSPNVGISRYTETSKGDGEQITAGQLSSSDANIDIVNDVFDGVGSLRREVSIVGGISMKSIELN